LTSVLSDGEIPGVGSTILKPVKGVASCQNGSFNFPSITGDSLVLNALIAESCAPRLKDMIRQRKIEKRNRILEILKSFKDNLFNLFTKIPPDYFVDFNALSSVAEDCPGE
jgi:hypothetical protein